jgi:hypothetical protein
VLVVRELALRAGRPYHPRRVAGWGITILGTVGLVSVVLAVDFMPVLLVGVLLLFVGRHRPEPAP